MTRTDDLHALPADLPVPVDDGACDHLPGMAMAAIELVATNGRRTSLLRASTAGRVVLYAYPRTGVPDREPPEGWDAIPGARGCTPQSCSFRDRHSLLTAQGVTVFGLSTQESAYQKEMVERLHLPFAVLSDADLELTKAMRLPTFVVEGEVLLKRFTLVLREGYVEKVFYPVFPPDENAAEVLRWLESAART